MWDCKTRNKCIIIGVTAEGMHVSLIYEMRSDYVVFELSRLVCITGSSAYDKTDIVQVDVDRSGTGTSKESFSYLVSVLQTSASTEMWFFSLAFCVLIPLLSCLFLVPHWESHPKCVS